jgi:hypothetical protein
MSEENTGDYFKCETIHHIRTEKLSCTVRTISHLILEECAISGTYDLPLFSFME